MYLLRVLEAVSQEQRGGKNMDSKNDDDKVRRCRSQGLEFRV